MGKHQQTQCVQKGNQAALFQHVSTVNGCSVEFWQLYKTYLQVYTGSTFFL